MTREEYLKIENEIYAEHNLKLHRLRTEYVEQNKKFNVGDFVYNVTGIIKVSKISYSLSRNYIYIVYLGYRFKKIKGVLSRTKDKNICRMMELHSLKLLEI